MNINKRSSIIGIVITVVLLIVLVIVTNANAINLRNPISKLVMPIQNGLTYLKNKIAGNNSFFTDINGLREENNQLKQKNSELEQQLRELEVIKAQNAVLKEYANLTEKYSEYTTVPAYVINKDISNLSENLVINAGKRDGIDVNMAVISEQGLVGYTIAVTDTTATVQTIIDAASSVSATISSTRDSIICKGILDNNTNLKATYIPTDATLVTGDTVETSGMGGIYPKGIIIGTIKEIVETKNITDRYAIVNTAVDFSKIETVLVIK